MPRTSRLASFSRNTRPYQCVGRNMGELFSPPRLRAFWDWGKSTVTQHLARNRRKLRPLFGRFSNRPFGVKRLQTIHRSVSMSPTGSCFSSGIGTKALPSWDSKTRWNNLWGGLAVRRTAGPSDRTNSPHPSSREGHRSTARWSSSFLLLHLILYSRHAVAACRVHRNSVPSTHMRCMITANRRARATIAFFIPRRLAICIAQALSQDHFFDRSMLSAAAS